MAYLVALRATRRVVRHGGFQRAGVLSADITATGASSQAAGVNAGVGLEQFLGAGATTQAAGVPTGVGAVPGNVTGAGVTTQATGVPAGVSVLAFSGVGATTQAKGTPTAAGAMGTGAILSNPVAVTQGTTATGDLTADGYTWAQGNPMVVDQFGKIMAWAMRANSSNNRHVLVVSNDAGATWSEPTRTGFYDSNGEGFLIRGAAVWDDTNNLLHTCWALLQGDGGVYYRQYSLTRDGSNNITGITRVRQMQLEAGVSGMAFEFPTALWCADIGAVVFGWSATNAGASTTKAENRLTMRVVSSSAADVVTTNWFAPLNENSGAGSTDTLGSSGLVKYSCVAKSAAATFMAATVDRKPSTAATHALDLVIAYTTNNTGLYYNKADWSGANSDWRGGLATAVANDAGHTTVLANLTRSGTDAGYNTKYQLISKLAIDTANDQIAVGIPTWKNNTDGDTWTVFVLANDGTVATTIDAYSAGSTNTDAGRDIFVTGDVMFDVTTGLVVTSWTDLMNHDGYVASYDNGVISQSPLAFYTATPIDIPTLHPHRVNDKLAILFRDFNVGARSNPPTYTPPYDGFYVTLDWSAVEAGFTAVGVTTQAPGVPAGVGVETFAAVGASTQATGTPAGVSVETFTGTGVTTQATATPTGASTEVFAAAGATTQAKGTPAAAGAMGYGGAGATTQARGTPTGASVLVFAAVGATTQVAGVSSGVGTVPDSPQGAGVTTQAKGTPAGVGLLAFVGAAVTTQARGTPTGVAWTLAGAGATTQAVGTTTAAGILRFLAVGATVQTQTPAGAGAVAYAAVGATTQAKGTPTAVAFTGFDISTPLESILGPTRLLTVVGEYGGTAVTGGARSLITAGGER